MRNLPIWLRATTLLFAASILVSGCRTMGRQIAAGAVEGLKEEQADAFVKETVDKVVAGTRDILLSDETSARIEHMVDSITASLQADLSRMLTALLDDLMGETSAARLDVLIRQAGLNANAIAGDIRDNLMGARTRLLMAGLRDELLGDATSQAMAGLMEQLLGAKTQAMIDALLDASIARVATGLETEIMPQITGAVANTQKSVKSTINYAAWALAILGAVLTIIIALLWRRFTTRTRILRLLTREIDGIPDQRQYDELVGRIRRRATRERLEKSLQSILKAQGLYQQPEWVNKDKQLLLTIAGHLKDDPQLYQRLKEKDLETHFRSVRNESMRLGAVGGI